MAARRIDSTNFAGPAPQLSIHFPNLLKPLLALRGRAGTRKPLEPNSGSSSENPVHASQVGASSKS